MRIQDVFLEVCRKDQVSQFEGRESKSHVASGRVEHRGHLDKVKEG